MIRQCLLTQNQCYQQGVRHEVQGIMLHSTGANNPYLKRYLAPDDGLIGQNQYGNHWNQFHPDGRQVCVHGFIGKLQNGSVATYQTLPWESVGWHSGSGSLGYGKNANNTGYVGVEICEDDLTDEGYFQAVYKEAVELCVRLCKEYHLDPLTQIIDHYEGHRKGIASNHGDVRHWFSRFGRSMEDLRLAVQAELQRQNEPAPDKPEQDDNPEQDKPAVLYAVQVGAFASKVNAQLCLEKLAEIGVQGFVVEKVPPPLEKLRKTNPQTGATV